LERVERLAVGPIADRVYGHREPDLRAAPHDPLELLAARDLDAASVEHPRRARSERAVHEGLEVADADERAPESAPDPDRRQLFDLIVGERLPDAQRERALRLEPLPDAQRPEPAVLVVDGRDSARVGEANAFAGGL